MLRIFSKRTIGAIRTVVLVVWFFAFSGVVYFYLFQPEFFRDQLAGALSISLPLGYAVYALLGCGRGFTFIPSTSLIVLGLLFFPPLPLYILTVFGILVSSASVYYFSELLRLDELFERKHQKYIAKIKKVLQKHELPIIIAWSFFPLVPTDVICYVSGMLNVNFKKFMLGILIGEGIVCAVYIFLGHYLISNITNLL